MGAEAAKIAASKKPTPVKISTTNPLLTEKTNSKSSADILSPKSTPLPKSPNTATATADKNEHEGNTLPPVELPDILSPRSIPLPQTPATVPKLEQQKPIHAPPSMHEDAANPALSAGPIKTTQKKESNEDSTTAKEVEKTQDQDPKDTSKAGVSVKEGEQEGQSSGEEGSSSAEAGAKE